jgi:sterol desaturase/sphingolipid hydroxylase (fatty acid hydroxylase superfamily)
VNPRFLAYYLSRAAISAGFGLLVFGVSWQALAAAGVIFCLFLLYLHSGWFQVNLDHPLFPLRRDERAREVQRKALIGALVMAVAVYLLATVATLAAQASALVLPLAVLTYFVMQFFLLARS